MRTLLVPCLGQVFYDGVPNYLWRCVSGEVLLTKVIEGVNADAFDRIVISFLSEEIRCFSPLACLPEKLKSRVEVCSFDDATNCVAETVFKTIKRMKIHGEVFVKDCDNYFPMDRVKGNFVVGIDVYRYSWDIVGLKRKSFLRVNEQSQIIDIIEKHLRTDVVSIGGYGFEDADDFVFAYERLCDESYAIDKLYVSHIIAYLIGAEERVFNYVPVLKYEDYGSQEEALAWRKRAHTKLRLAVFDLDGTLFDTTEVNYRAYKEALGELGAAFTYEKYKNECNGKNYREFLPLFITVDANIMEQIHEKKKNVYSRYMSYARAHKHLLTMLRLMSYEYHIAVVTTASRRNAEDILSAHQIMPFVELLVTQEDVDNLKPATDSIDMAMQYFHVDSVHTIVFEDSRPGLIAAQNSGADYLQVYKYNGERG